jgi:hypothetical protein
MQPVAAALLIFAAVAPLARSQTGEEVETNALGWFAYSGDHPVQGRWGVHAEIQFRRDGVLARPQHLLVRPALNIEITKSLSAAVGYTYTRTYPYGSNPDPFAYPEHRSYQDLTFQHDLAEWKMSHRLRVEQRFVSDAGTVPDEVSTRWRYGNRFRYALQLQRSLSGQWYLSASLEPQIRFGIHYRGRAFDQLQSYVGIGRELTEHWKVELGYSHQVGVPRRGRIYENNHIVRLAIQSTAPLKASP